MILCSKESLSDRIELRADFHIYLIPSHLASVPRRLLVLSSFVAAVRFLFFARSLLLPPSTFSFYHTEHQHLRWKIQKKYVLLQARVVKLTSDSFFLRFGGRVGDQFSTPALSFLLQSPLNRYQLL